MESNQHIKGSVKVEKERKVIEEYNNRRAQVENKNSDLPVVTVASWVKDGTVEISPDFQRRDRWDDVRRSRLIESLLMDIPVPPFYLSSEDDGPYTVIDGKQRLTAIHKFVNEGMPLRNLEFLKELEGYTYEDIPGKLRGMLQVEPAFRVVTVISKATGNQQGTDVKYRVFHRLNTGGIELEPQEIRNAIYRGSLNDLITELSTNEYIRKQLKVTPGTKGYAKMKDHECVLRFLCMHEQWKNVGDDIRALMDRFMSDNCNLGADKIEEWSDEYLTMAQRVESIFGDSAFRSWNASSKSWRDQQNLALYDAESIAVSLLDEGQFSNVVASRDKVISALIDAMKNDAYFTESVGRGTGSQAKVTYRVEKVYEILKSSVDG